MAKYLNRKDTAHMMSHVPYPYTLEDAVKFIARTNIAEANKVVNGIYDKTDRFMGVVGIHGKDSVFSLGYWLGYPFWGQGIMTEACQLNIATFFSTTEQTEIHVTHFLHNTQSASIIAKLGFSYIGEKMLDMPARNMVEPVKQYILTKQDWVNRVKTC